MLQGSHDTHYARLLVHALLGAMWALPWHMLHLACAHVPQFFPCSPIHMGHSHYGSPWLTQALVLAKEWQCAEHNTHTSSGERGLWNFNKARDLPLFPTCMNLHFSNTHGLAIFSNLHTFALFQAAVVSLLLFYFSLLLFYCYSIFTYFPLFFTTFHH